MKKIIIVFLFVLIPMEGAARLFIPTTKQELNSSDVVFTGHLTNFTCKDNKRTSEFLVHDIWKGRVQKKYYFVEGSNEECTGSKYLELNKKYKIFAKYKDGDEIVFLPYCGVLCGGGGKSISMFWDEWDEKTKFRKFFLNWWFHYNLSKLGNNHRKNKWLLDREIFKYWLQDYYELGKPKHVFNN